MNKEQLTQLIRILNAIMTIETKGENTLIMAECIQALQHLAHEVQKQIQEE